ncbi:MAG TPA: DNA cytosine methyltransferase [Caldilineaceae bacterium]|nr:DNA cytosine methyltransferase [Caldilineaceae bacterium]
MGTGNWLLDVPLFAPEAWQFTATGLAMPRAYRPAPSRPTCIDLFCGAGGFSLGMIQGGFQVIAACDNDPSAAITYLANLGAYPINLVCLTPEDRARLERALSRAFKERPGIQRAYVSGSNRPPDRPGVPHFFFGDVRKLTGEMILRATGMERGEIDCVVGGPPCQGFSRAGKRKVMDPRNSLVFEFARLVLELRPKTMVIENVPDIATMVTPDGLPVLDELCQILEDGGWGTLNAIKRALSASSGAGAALRNGKGRRPQAHLPADEQLTLFGEAQHG